MKVAHSVRELYQALEGDFARLKKDVDQTLTSRKKPSWHYESRVKSLESFALKLQTGRVRDPNRLEDFFGCTLVVENRSAIAEARSLIKELYTIVERRPPSDERTRLEPESFAFDDLRLYVTLSLDPSRRPTELQSLKFEIQIKTFLQHAWGIATHDLVYKSAEVDWAKSRIAYQVKAMLENAETSIAAAAVEEVRRHYPRSNDKFHLLREIIDAVNSRWESAQIPTDRVRMATTFVEFSNAAKLPITEIFSMVDAETALGRGAAMLQYSPFEAAVDAWFRKRPTDAVAFLEGDSKKRDFFLLIPDEIELPVGADRKRLRRGQVLDRGGRVV